MLWGKIFSLIDYESTLILQKLVKTILKIINANARIIYTRITTP